jgi:ubiquinone/menaquinone biosynthesis C-methylase UbiE
MVEHNQKQVNTDHYEFSKYVSKKRWISYWHQLDEILKHKPTNVLEIGVGSGIIKVLCDLFGVDIKTVDIDQDLKSDYNASVLSLPIDNDSFDLVVCFQVLEHIRYEEFFKALTELHRVARRYVILSLPDARKVWSYQFYLPKIGSLYFHIPRPKIGEYIHKFDGEHYWEINKKGYSLNQIISDIKKVGFILEKSYRVNENPYHRFFIMRTSKGK